MQEKKKSFCVLIKNHTKSPNKKIIKDLTAGMPISPSQSTRLRRALPHCAPLICTLATQSHPGTAGINTLYFAVLSRNPTWQPCDASDRGGRGSRAIGCNVRGICRALIRSERMPPAARRHHGVANACARQFSVRALPQTRSDGGKL